MLVKFFPKGKCGLDYCLGKKLKGEDIRHPEVLAGDPVESGKILKGLDFANPYTSVALTYEREISPEEAARDIASFEAMILPGMTPGLEYARVWIRHTESPKDPTTKCLDPSKPKRTALHCIIPNVHLPTGKRLQPYYDPADRKRVEAWQELTNESMGYASPKDPERRRAVVLSVNRLPKKVADLKSTITKAVMANLQAEQINTRDELCTWFKDQGFVVERITKKSISISHHSLIKHVRLEGEFYEHRGIENAASARDSGEKPERRIREIGSDQRSRELAEGLQRKRLELAKRYPHRSTEDPGSFGVRSQSNTAGLREDRRGGAPEAGQFPTQDIDHGRNPSASGDFSDRRGNTITDLVHSLEGDNTGVEHHAAERSPGLGGNQNTANPGQERISSVENADRGRAEALGGGKDQAGQIDDLAGQGRQHLRGSTPGREAPGIPGEHDNSSPHKASNPLIHDTTKSDPNGDAFARYLGGLIRRTREAAERTGKTLAAASRAIAERFFLGPQRLRELKETARPGIDAALHIGRKTEQVGAILDRVFQASRGNEQEQQRNDSSLWQGGGCVQFNEERIPEISLGGNSVKRLSQLIASTPMPQMNLPKINRESPGFSR